jgi:hypothetical protein
MEKKKSKNRKPYQKPTLKTEKVLEAGLGAVCNGSSVGGRKSSAPCTIIKS